MQKTSLLGLCRVQPTFCKDSVSIKNHPPVSLNYVKHAHFATQRPSIPPISPPLPHGLPHRFAAESRHENGENSSFLLENSYAHIKAFLLSAQKVFVTKFLTCVTNFVTRITNFVISVTNFVTKTILYERKKSLIWAEDFSRRKEENICG